MEHFPRPVLFFDESSLSADEFWSKMAASIANSRT